MINTSAAFKAAIQANARQLALKATLKVGAQTYELTGSDFEGGSLSATTACMSKGFELGTAIAADLSFALNNRSGAWNDVPLDGATIWPYAGLKLAGGTTEYVPLGTFIIDQPGRPYASLQVKAADRMILLDRPFSEVTITYPATFLEILQAICLKCNVPLSTQALSAPNISTQVTEAPTGEYSCRDIVAEISLYAAGFARMSREGELEIVGLSKPEALTAYNMPIGSRSSFTQTTDAITITGLKYGDQLWGTSDYTVTVDKLALNPSSSLLQYVFDQISSFTYVPYNAEYPGNPALEAGDPVLHTTRDGKTLLSLITKHKYKHGGRCSMTAEGKSASEVSYRSANERRLSQAAAQVKAEVEQDLTTYEQSSAQLADMLGLMMGTYRTVETDESGAETHYFHNLPALEDSDIIWKFNGQALGISNDGGLTWATGITADSNLIVQQIKAIGLDAEWIKSGTIHISSTTATFAEGYDPTTKETPEGAAQKAATVQNSLLGEIEDLETSTNDQFATIEKYVRIENGTILLGETGNEITLKITNNRISFMQGTYEVAYISDNKLFIVNGEFVESIIIGKYAFTLRSNGSLSFGKVK